MLAESFELKREENLNSLDTTYKTTNHYSICSLENINAFLFPNGKITSLTFSI